MEVFQWDSHFTTGIETVDQQHHKLVDLINRLGNLLVNNEHDQGVMDALLSELADYAVYHFSEEESMMAEIGIDQRHLAHHKKLHKDFLLSVTSLKSSLSTDAPDSGKHLLDFLVHWLAFHILGEDQGMARQIKKIETGIKPEEAYEAEERDRSDAMTPLLAALSGLFEKVSASNLELLALNQSLEDKVLQRTAELSSANERLELISLTDSLTGLPNRRYALAALEKLWEESNQNDKLLACMMIDADHFKEVNDNYGHDAGDLVLKELARALKHALRTDDLVCRLGGDEFLVICPNTNEEGCMYIAELMRKKISELRVPTSGEPWHGSVSVGVAARNADTKNCDTLLKRADKNLYAAKDAGKNCVSSAS